MVVSCNSNLKLVLPVSADNFLQAFLAVDEGDDPLTRPPFLPSKIKRNVLSLISYIIKIFYYNYSENKNALEKGAGYGELPQGGEGGEDEDF